jgi:hypothetical protein
VGAAVDERDAGQGADRGADRAAVLLDGVAHACL